VDALVQHFYHDTVGPYWPPERAHVENGYRALPFPFMEIAAPPFAMEAAWTLPQLLGYFRSWSAAGRYAAATGHDPVTSLAEQLQPLWGEARTARKISWPLALRVGRVEG
jgi:hypothetical protein